MENEGGAGVVVAIDGSSGSLAALRWAARDAEIRKVPLRLVHVVPPTAGPWRETACLPSWMSRHRDRGRRALSDALGLLEQIGYDDMTNVSCEMLSAPTVAALVSASEKADVIVVGCLGTGTLRGRHLGSVSSGLSHYARAPVAVIHDGISRTDDTAPVLVGIDGSPDSDAATAIAFDEASRRGVVLLAVHAWKDVNVFDPVVSFPGPGWPVLHARAQAALSDRLREPMRRYPRVSVCQQVVRGEPAWLLAEHAHRAQLVVVGSRGRDGFAGMLMGSVSSSVLLTARVPVIIARHAFQPT